MLHRLKDVVDAVDGGDECFGAVVLTLHQHVAVGAGEHAEPAAQLVGAVATQLAPVALLERAPAAAALTELLGTGVELGDLGGVAGDERCRGLVDQGEQLVDRGDHGSAGAVDARRERGERRTP